MHVRFRSYRTRQSNRRDADGDKEIAQCYRKEIQNKMTPYSYRKLQRKVKRKVRMFKRAFRAFWKEWGITKQDFNDIIACLSLFGMLYMIALISIIVLK